MRAVVWLGARCGLRRMAHAPSQLLTSSAAIGGARELTGVTARNKKPGAKAGLVAIGDGVARYLLRELRDLVAEARDFAAGQVLVNDVALRRLHQGRLGELHRFLRRGGVARLDGVLDGAERRTHLRAARLVDDGAARDLAGRLLGGGRIGHLSNIL